MSPDLPEPVSPALLRRPATDVVASYARFTQRELRREGIPMFLALQDARTGRPPVVDDGTARREGERLAQLFDHYEAGLAPVLTGLEAEPAPDLTGGAPLIAVLVVLAEEHPREDGTRP